MNRLCITLDDVIRAKTQQFGKIYKKYVDKDKDLDAIEIKSNDLAEAFGFTHEEYMKFLYNDYAFEVFAEAPVVEKMIDKKLNLWHIALNNDREEDDKIELILANPYEFNASIGFTHFFLSQIATRVRETYFPANSLEIWDKCNALVTADPKLLKNKPEGKISVKITTDYNKDCDAEYTYGCLREFLEDEEIIGKIFPVKEHEQEA